MHTQRHRLWCPQSNLQARIRQNHSTSGYQRCYHQGFWCREHFRHEGTQRFVDCRRPDGLTVLPWQDVKPLAWDVTVICSLADSYVPSYPLWATAELAAFRKTDEYASLPNSYLLFENFGTLNLTAISFILELGRRIRIKIDDGREPNFLFHRRSVTLQRFNSVFMREGFEAEDDPDK